MITNSTYITAKKGFSGDSVKSSTSPRLDNLTAVEGCLDGILSAKHYGKDDDTISLIALYDNEEVGSRTKQGAASTALDRLMEKLYLSLGFDRDQYLSAMFKSFLLSMDVAHAYHSCIITICKTML